MNKSDFIIFKQSLKVDLINAISHIVELDCPEVVSEIVYTLIEDYNMILDNVENCVDKCKEGECHK